MARLLPCALALALLSCCAEPLHVTTAQTAPAALCGARLLPALRGGGGPGVPAEHAGGAADPGDDQARPRDEGSDDDDAELDAWLAGWKAGGGAGKRKRAAGPAAGPEASGPVKSRRTADNAGPTQDPDGVAGDSAEDFEAAMRIARGPDGGQRAGEGTEGTNAGGKGEPRGSKPKAGKSALRPEKWPAPKQERRKTEADLEAENAQFLKKVRLLEEEVGGARGLFLDGNVTEQYTIPDYSKLEPGVPLPRQYRFNRSEDMVEPAPYDWDDYRCEFDTEWSPFPENNTLIGTINGISLRVQTHPRRKDQVHLRPTAPDVYYALNHELIDNPRGVRWEVKVTGLPQHASTEQLRRVLAAQRDKQQHRSRAPRREVPAFNFGAPVPQEVDVQHITLSNGDCVRAVSHEFPWGLDDISTTPSEYTTGRNARDVKSAVVTCSTAHGARTVARAFMDMRASKGGDGDEDAQGWGKVRVQVERVEEMLDDSWADEPAAEGAVGVLVDDGKGGKTYRVSGKLGMEVRPWSVYLMISRRSWI